MASDVQHFRSGDNRSVGTAGASFAMASFTVTAGMIGEPHCLNVVSLRSAAAADTPSAVSDAVGAGAFTQRHDKAFATSSVCKLTIKTWVPTVTGPHIITLGYANNHIAYAATMVRLVGCDPSAPFAQMASASGSSATAAAALSTAPAGSSYCVLAFHTTTSQDPNVTLNEAWTNPTANNISKNGSGTERLKIRSFWSPTPDQNYSLALTDPADGTAESLDWAAFIAELDDSLGAATIINVPLTVTVEEPPPPIPSGGTLHRRVSGLWVPLA